MMRRTLAILALVLAAAPALAQSAASDDAGKKVKDGSLPAGWRGRTDRPTQKLSDAKFTTMGKGYHVTSGPAAIYWHEKHKLTAPYTVTATMTQTKAPTHPEAYGIFLMGSKLDQPDLSYFYVLVRGTGDVLVSHRAGADVHTVKPWAPNAAVVKQDASGKATNTFRVVAAADSTRVWINGTPVFALAASYAQANGYAGLRVNHNLDIHVDEFTVTPGSSASAKKKAKRAPAKRGY